MAGQLARRPGPPVEQGQAYYGAAVVGEQPRQASEFGAAHARQWCIHHAIVHAVVSVSAETIRSYSRRMSDTTMVTVTRHADVRAVLANPRFAVPPVPTDAPAVSVAWLRAQVARFSTGAVHERRRALAVAELDRISPVTLRRRAAERAAAVLSEATGRPADRLAAVARAVPVGVLAEALGVTAGVVDEVAVVARGYHPGTDAGPAGDDAVAHLVEVCGGMPDEATAARIGLLVQACDATAGLIGNAVTATPRSRVGAPIRAILAETLRHDPPVRAIRRMAVEPAHISSTKVAAGCLVHLDLAAANRDPAVFADADRFDPARSEKDRHLTLGAGLRPCPGSDHAFAIATGVFEAASRGRLLDADAEERPPPSAPASVPPTRVGQP